VGFDVATAETNLDETMKSKPVATTVYIVDDDADVLLSLKFLLETEGFSVRTFRSGQELLETAPQQHIDCLIIDYKMPGMDGLDLVRQLRVRDVRGKGRGLRRAPCRAEAAHRRKPAGSFVRGHA
jgi:CheY-like chemotaxis protein